MMKESDIDPIKRELVDLALSLRKLDWRVMPLRWYFVQDGDVIHATGYVTVSQQHKADEIRQGWADALGLDGDQAGGVAGEYLGKAGLFKLHMPDVIDPNEHCRVCGLPFDMRDESPVGRKPYQDGDVCRSCMARHAAEEHPVEERPVRKTP